jgi:carbonic anhydrase
MTDLDTFLQRNQTFAASGFRPGLTMMPSARTLIVGCVDPRVDPANVLGLELGEAAVIRNVGGRITADVVQTVKMLQTVAQAGGAVLGSAGWNLVVLHHTDCGIRALQKTPDDLARFLGVSVADLGQQGITDAHVSVKLDVARLKAEATLPAELVVSGLVYDVATGKIETVVAPALLRPA